MSQARPFRRRRWDEDMDASRREALAAIQVRRCMYCGCTDANACRLRDGEPCVWSNSLCTVCTNPACLRAHSAARRWRRRRKRGAA